MFDTFYHFTLVDKVLHTPISGKGLIPMGHNARTCLAQEYSFKILMYLAKLACCF